MRNFEELSNFVKSNSDWLNKLKPWLKTSHECDYNNDWVILMYNLFEIPSDPELYKIICECRGSVVNKKTGEIICAPFVKFWNLGEGKADKNIDWKNAYYSHKRDGWLCKLSMYDGKAYIFTNGMYLSKNNRGAPVESSIHPEYGFKDIADIFLHCIGANGFNDDGSVYWKKIPNWVKSIHNGDTVMFELESPWNVIHTHLVDEPKLWLIGYRDYEGDELDIWEEHCENGKFGSMPFDVPVIYNFHSAEELLSKMKEWKVDENGEGIVVLSIDENHDFHRVKIKCEDYLKIKYMENCSNISDNILFKLMLNGEADDLIAVQPSLLSRVEIIKNKFNDFKIQVSAGENYVKHLVEKFPVKKDLVFFLKGDKNFSFYMHCLNAKSYLDRIVEVWKIAKDGYKEMCSILDNLTN